MKVGKIKWIDDATKEAIVFVDSDSGTLICYSCPCEYNVGDEITEPLECLDADKVTTCNENFMITKLESVFGYEIQGEIINCKEGIVHVEGFVIHIDEDEIPRDINTGMYIQFETHRIDIW